MLTHGKLLEHVLKAIGLKPTSLASTSATGAYHSLSKWEKALFTLKVGAMADAKTAALQIMQATDALGTAAKVITGALATITAPSGASIATVTATTVADGNVITINDQVFPCEDTTPDASLGQFASGANDTEAMANLATVINALLPKVLATSAVNVLTLKATEPSEETITIAAATGTMVPAVVEALALVEVSCVALDDDNDFTHVAAKVTTDATIVSAVDLTLAGGRFSPEQKVAASTSVIV